LANVTTRENLKTLGNNTTVQTKLKAQAQSLKTVQSMVNGMREKSIIELLRDHYTSIHPTQKPVRLLERLIQLCLPNKPKNEIVVADFFGGSFSTAEAVHNLGCKSIICELDEEYFNLGNDRIVKIIHADLF